MTIRSDDFQFLATLLKQHSGIVITEEKAYSVEARLQVLARKYGMNGVDEICQRLRGQGDNILKEDVVEMMTINETYFFRDHTPFSQFRDFIVPELIKHNGSKKHLRIWSAGSSSGQEAYSLAIVLQELAAPLSDWQIEIIGTDLSHEMTARAKQGIYSQFEIQRGLPAAIMLKYFTQQDGKWQVNENIRQMVKFSQHNLLSHFSELGLFDVILCRNVLTYFDQATKNRVLSGISRQLNNHGFLVIGAAETLLGLSTRFKTVPHQRGIYAMEPEEASGIFKAM